MKPRTLMESGSTCEASGHSQHLPRDVRRQARSERLPRVSFHEVVAWFKGLGYTVEPGPGLDEVTLIADRRPEFITHMVVPAEKLPGMAGLSQVVTTQQIFRPHRMEGLRPFQAGRQVTACPENNVRPRLDNPLKYCMMLSFRSIQEDVRMMRIVTKSTQAARLRPFGGGVLLPWSQCAFR